MNDDSNMKDTGDIIIPKDKIRKVGSEQVEILDADRPNEPKHPFGPGGFSFKNVKVISGGPFVFLLPLLIPLILVVMIVAFIPMMLFGRKIIMKRR
ncbi:MAG: hypothetical protein JST80_04035 [Bdellovibrionales bacterium]|nr:hypothetical protein [Bdellovibrionales bacterium]